MRPQMFNTVQDTKKIFIDHDRFVVEINFFFIEEGNEKEVSSIEINPYQ